MCSGVVIKPLIERLLYLCGFNLLRVNIKELLLHFRIGFALLGNLLFFEEK